MNPEIKTPSPSPCSFCQPESSRMTHFERYGKDRLDLVKIAESDNIIAKIDSLPADPHGYHFLMIPKRHKFSFADNEDLAHETGKLKRELENMTGEPLIIFEHGGTKEGNKNMSIYHQHA